MAQVRYITGSKILRILKKQGTSDYFLDPMGLYNYVFIIIDHSPKYEHKFQPLVVCLSNICLQHSWKQGFGLYDFSFCTKSNWSNFKGYVASRGISIMTGCVEISRHFLFMPSLDFSSTLHPKKAGFDVRALHFLFSLFYFNLWWDLLCFSCYGFLIVMKLIWFDQMGLDKY